MNCEIKQPTKPVCASLSIQRTMIHIPLTLDDCQGMIQFDDSVFAQYKN
jgi:hypothetical protein